MKHNRFFIRRKVTAYITVLALLFFYASFVYGEGVVLNKQPVAIEYSDDMIRKAVDRAVAKIRPALVRIFVVSVKYKDAERLSMNPLVAV